jgi:hypothetical protein
MKGLLLFLLVISATPAGAQAPEPVILILEVEGKLEPATSAFSELPAGTRLTLASGTRLRFVHYKSCRVTSVRGGELTVLPSGHLLREGVVEADDIRSCPKRLAAGARSGVAGGLVMRGSGGAILQLPSQPVLMVAGPRAERFAQVALEAPPVRVPFERASGAPVWRHAGPLLAPGRYRLVATSAVGHVLVDELVDVVATEAGPSDVIILRTD